MNVLHYFLSSPDFAKPAMIVHLGSHGDDVLNPDELNALLALWQNPTYPENSYFTQDQFNATARADSMQRAQSPGALLCLLEEVDSITHPQHIHTFSECMGYRSLKVIAADAPWIYWTLFDESPFIFKPPEVIQPPIIPHGWMPIARVNPAGISEMNGWSPNWTGYTFATQIGASKINTTYGPGKQLRVLIVADCIFGSLYIGPAGLKPFLATTLHRLSFGGQNTNIVVDGSFYDGGPGMQWSRLSDPLPQGIDAPNGLIICGYVYGVVAGAATAWLAIKGSEQDWSCRYALGDHAADLDKSKMAGSGSGSGSAVGAWYPGGTSDYAVLMVEALY
jgi:hypothetical protein